MNVIPNAYVLYKAQHIKAGLCVECCRKVANGLFSVKNSFFSDL